MPFTLSHPAAVVPLARRGLPFSALVVGSMAPDFPYFMLRSTRSDFSHSWQGLFLIDLPTGLLVLWLFHVALKYPLLSLLPKAHRLRLAPMAGRFTFQGRRNWLFIVLALLIGSVTHLAWDWVTHYYGWQLTAYYTNWGFLQAGQTRPDSWFPDFRRALFTTPMGEFSLFDLLQNGSSVFGVLALAWCYRRWFKNAEPGDTDLDVVLPQSMRLACRVAFPLGLVLSAGVALLICDATFKPVALSDWLNSVARQTAVWTIKAGLLELLLFALLWHWAANRSRSGGAKNSAVS